MECFFRNAGEGVIQDSSTVLLGLEEAVRSVVLSRDGSDDPDLFLAKKLVAIREKVKAWRKERLLVDKQEEDEASALVEDLENILETRKLTETEEWMLAEGKKVLKDLSLSKISDLKQRARVRWALDGDENSSYFHGCINGRKAANAIPGLSLNGEWISSPPRVKKEVLAFFRSRFKEALPCRPRIVCNNFKKISADQSSFLIAPFSYAEVKEAVFGCGDDRAPGPDGFNFRFIKHFWDFFEEDFRAIAGHFFSSSKINVGCSSSFITLVPKSADPVSLNGYRPINLVGVISKFLSKLLANRLKVVVGSVISEAQSAFLKGKFILDGPLVLNEVINWCKKNRKQAFILKIDFEKAYDNVNWNFLVDSMLQMGFPSLWVSWINGIVSSARSSVLVNGSPTFEFQCGKGLRQGDPISPFLFLMVMEVLACMIDKGVEVGVLNGICSPAEGPTISHLLFADDAVIIGDWSKVNLENVVRILRCFRICSGLKINLSKCNLFGLGVETPEVEGLASVVGCSVGGFPFKFLGVVVGANMNKISNWKPVSDVFDARLSRWKSSCLSIGGRVVLIKSVLQSLPGYYFSLFRAPVSVIKNLEGKIKKFLWGNVEGRRPMYWVNWDRVALPKDKGGLGLAKLASINISLLVKWGWRYKTEQNVLWKRVVDAFHTVRRNWDFFPCRKGLGGPWSNIVKVLSTTNIEGVPLQHYFKGAVGNGRDITFWVDQWVGDKPLKDLCPLLFGLERKKRCKVGQRLIKYPEGMVKCWEWSRQPMSGQEVLELARLYSALDSVSLSDQSDRWIWSGSIDGGFSVGSVKDMLTADRDVSGIYILEWCKWIPAKCNIFAWRAEMDRLPTAAALSRRGILMEDPNCPFCSECEETVDHIFTACSFAVVIWQHLSVWCGIPSLFAFSFKDLLEFQLFSGLSGKKKEVLYGLIIIVCWSIWRSRNGVRFNNKEARVEDVISEIKACGFLWAKNRAKLGHLSWSDWCKFVFM
ncbi:putative RNA-directed DNA polymerase [Helianthus annuus]|nr:putative RNA-directed DNA polymerase [Helianthus annuus]